MGQFYLISCFVVSHTRKVEKASMSFTLQLKLGSISDINCNQNDDDRGKYTMLYEYSIMDVLADFVLIHIVYPSLWG